MIGPGFPLSVFSLSVFSLSVFSLSGFTLLGLATCRPGLSGVCLGSDRNSVWGGDRVLDLSPFA